MTILTVNKINVGHIISVVEEPKGGRRDIGNLSEGSADGSIRISRQGRKRDLKFKTVPLSNSDANSWEGLFIGEGDVWTFDTSTGFYSSKGLGPAINVNCSIASGSPKYGSAKLIVGATTGSILYEAAQNLQFN